MWGRARRPRPPAPRCTIAAVQPCESCAPAPTAGHSVGWWQGEGKIHSVHETARSQPRMPRTSLTGTHERVALRPDGNYSEQLTAHLPTSRSKKSGSGREEAAHQQAILLELRSAPNARVGPRLRSRIDDAREIPDDAIKACAWAPLFGEGRGDVGRIDAACAGLTARKVEMRRLLSDRPSATRAHGYARLHYSTLLSRYSAVTQPLLSRYSAATQSLLSRMAPLLSHNSSVTQRYSSVTLRSSPPLSNNSRRPCV